MYPDILVHYRHFNTSISLHISSSIKVASSKASSMLASISDLFVRSRQACVHQEFKAFVASSSFFFNADTPGPALMLRLVKADRLGASCLTGAGFLTILLIESETMLEPSSPPRSLVHIVLSYDSINLGKIRPRFWISDFCPSLGLLGHTNLNPLSLLHPFMPEPQQQLQKPNLYRIEA